eukprot:UC4_evm1s575
MITIVTALATLIPAIVESTVALALRRRAQGWGCSRRRRRGLCAQADTIAQVKAGVTIAAFILPSLLFSAHQGAVPAGTHGLAFVAFLAKVTE